MKVRCIKCKWEGEDLELLQEIRDVDDYDTDVCPDCLNDGFIEEIEEKYHDSGCYRCGGDLKHVPKYGINMYKCTECGEYDESPEGEV